jgi:RecB family exonuclease
MEVEDARTAMPDERRWRQSKTEPVEVWRTMGLEFVRAYIDWRKRSPWEIWTTPDGWSAIELDVSGLLPGCPVEIKAYLDRVFWDPDFKRLWILDLKSGKKPPVNADQFGTYAALLEVKYGIRANHGVAFMNRKATLGKPFELSEYTPEHVGQIYGEAWQKIQAGDFKANPGSACYICDVEDACAVKSGPLAYLYDPDHPNYAPPF